MLRPVPHISAYVSASSFLFHGPYRPLYVAFLLLFGVSLVSHRLLPSVYPSCVQVSHDRLLSASAEHRTKEHNEQLKQKPEK